MTNYNNRISEVVTRLRIRGFSGSVDYMEPRITISKFGVEVSSSYNPAIEGPKSFCDRICKLWELKYISPDAPYLAQALKIANNSVTIPEIEKVIFNYPATIVFWSDGTKTVVKCSENDIFDQEKGLAMAITKRALGNKGNYCDELKKWTKDLPEPDSAISTDAYMAYHRLVNALHDKKATKADLGAAMEEAVGYLGHLLDL